jgi:uncharacterized protein
MPPNTLGIEEVIEGRNSVLLSNSNITVLYEKLANTIHSGERSELLQLQREVECIDYNPEYEAGSLRAQKTERMSGLVLNVTENCDFRCSYCQNNGAYERERRINPARMEFETARKGVDLFMPRAKEPALISFYGGEPLLNMDLVARVISYTRRRYPNQEARFSMTTNFYDAERHFSTIVDNDIHLLVSIDGPRQIHDNHRVHVSGKETWGRIMENLRRLERYSPGYVRNKVGISVTVPDYSELKTIVDYFMATDLNIFRVGGIEQKGLRKGDGVKDLSQVLSLASDFCDRIDKQEPLPDILRLLFESRLKTISARSRKEMPSELMLQGSCYPGNRKLYVDTSGELYMCEKFGGRMTIGHVDTGISDPLVDDSIGQFQKIRNQLCTSGCWAQRLCTPCIQAAKDPEGEISVEGLAQTCGPSKHEIMLSLMLYTEIIKRNKGYIESLTQR